MTILVHTAFASLLGASPDSPEKLQLHLELAIISEMVTAVCANTGLLASASAYLDSDSRPAGL